MKGTKSRAAAMMFFFAVGGSSIPCAGFQELLGETAATLPSPAAVLKQASEDQTAEVVDSKADANGFQKRSLLPQGQPSTLTPAQFERLRRVARAALRRLGDDWGLAQQKGFSKGLFTKHTMQMDGFLNGEHDIVLRSLSLERDHRDGTRQSFMIRADGQLSEVQFDVEKTVLLPGWRSMRLWLLEERLPIDISKARKVAREELDYWLNRFDF